jgi:hypothetical protein
MLLLLPTAGHAAALLWGFMHSNLNCWLAGRCLDILLTDCCCCCDCSAGACVAAFAPIRSICSAALAVNLTVLRCKLWQGSISQHNTCPEPLAHRCIRRHAAFLITTSSCSSSSTAAISSFLHTLLLLLRASLGNSTVAAASQAAFVAACPHAWLHC